MAADTITLDGGGVSVRVEGLGRTLRMLRKAGADAQAMSDAMHTIGSIVADAAHPPVGKTGNLASSVRAGRGKTKAVVRAGGRRVPYAGVIHYGWPARDIEAQPFLTDAFARNRSRVFDEFDNQLAALLEANNLT